MDIVKCAVASAVEVVLQVQLGYIQPGVLLHRFFSLLLVQYIALELFYILIWPFYVSPLRKLPGPKVMLFRQTLHRNSQPVGWNLPPGSDV